MMEDKKPQGQISAAAAEPGQNDHQESLQTNEGDLEENNKEEATSDDAAMTRQASIILVEPDQSFLQRMKFVVTNFWPLGFIAFGGPTVHIALYRQIYVEQRKQLDETLFLELFGLCQAIPGPTSTQMVIAMATMYAGIPGGMLMYLMWSFPGFVVMAVTGVISGNFFNPNGGTPDWMAGLAPAATSQVFVATWQISKPNASSKLKVAQALFAACATLIVMGDSRINPQLGSISFPTVLCIGGLTSMIDSRRKDRMQFYFTPITDENERLAHEQKNKRMNKNINISRPLGALIILTWLVVLVVVIVLRGNGVINNNLGILFEGMYFIGSLIYGGGQVVLPMLQQEHYASPDQFFQGFALIQALPGPLFSFSAFLGGVFAGVPGTFVGIMGINLPGMLLTFGVLPYWAWLRRKPDFKVFITGVSSASIGLLVTACVQLYAQSVKNAANATVFLVSGAMTVFFNVPVPISIGFGSLLGYALSPGAISIGQASYCEASTFAASNSTSG